MAETCLNCDAGRTMGCRTYCCRLLVRLTEDEAQQLYPDRPSARFLEKADDELCLYLDRETYRCGIWDKRPEVCRSFDCNTDFLLQVAIKEQFESIVDLAKKAQRIYLPRHLWVKVPQMDALSAGSSGQPEESRPSSEN